MLLKIILCVRKEQRKEIKVMLKRDKQILETFKTVIPQLSESDKSYLLGLSDGMAMRLGEKDIKQNNNVSPHQLSFDDILSGKDV